MLLENMDEKKRIMIGKKIELAKGLIDDISDFCFTTADKDTPCEDIVENFEGASDIHVVIGAYINGHSVDAIGEAVFQDDGDPVKKILEMFGLKV